MYVLPLLGSLLISRTRMIGRQSRRDGRVGLGSVSGVTEAIGRYGVPCEVLTDNGKQFTGRFTKPFPVEVMFERICREYGITHRLTKPRSPTTTGKIERWHGSLHRELLDACGPFESLAVAQSSIEAWVHAYNYSRPHQALNMATPISAFRPVPARSKPTAHQRRPYPRVHQPSGCRSRTASTSCPSRILKARQSRSTWSSLRPGG